MTSSLGNIMIGWFLSNVKYANVVIFYAIYAIQKDLKAITRNASLLKGEWIDIYDIIVMILTTRKYDLQN